MSVIQVSGLNSYPIKSGHVKTHQQVSLFDYGLVMDRNLVIIRDDVPQGKDNFLSQRFPGGEKLVNLSFCSRAGHIVLGDVGESIALDHEIDTRRYVRIHNRETSGIDCGDAVAARLSNYFGFAVRMVRADDESLTPVDPNYADHGLVAYGDGFSFLFLNEASLQALNAEGDFQIPMDRFRGNVILSGLRPFEEDMIETLRINGVEFTLGKPCSRCAIPDVDQLTGQGDKGRDEVTQRLRAFRMGVSDVGRPATFMGMNAVNNLEHDQTATLRVGMQVEVMKSREAPHPFVQNCQLKFNG